MQAHHRAAEPIAPTAPALAALPRGSDLWDGWGDAGVGAAALDDDAESLDLSGVL